MTNLTKVIIKKDIAELEDAIHEVYLSGADVTDEGSKEIARLEESIRELEALLE